MDLRLLLALLFVVVQSLINRFFQIREKLKDTCSFMFVSFPKLFSNLRCNLVQIIKSSLIGLGFCSVLTYIYFGEGQLVAEGVFPLERLRLLTTTTLR